MLNILKSIFGGLYEQIMKQKYFILILTFMLAVFSLCSCSKKQSEQKENEKETKRETVIYSEIEQEGAVNQPKGSSIYIMHPDFGVFTQEENEAIKAIGGVIGTEYYGGAARTKYYYQFGKDYDLLPDFTELLLFQPVDQEAEEHFIRSSENITQEDLEKGKLPEADNEIALYTSNPDMLGKTIEMYFSCNDLFDQNSNLNAWGAYIEKDMVICGILKEKTEQIYFADSFCDMMGKTMTEFVLKSTMMTVFETGNYTDGFVRIQDQFGPEGSIKLGCLWFEDLIEWNGEYDLTISSYGRTDSLVTYIDDSLDTSEVLLSKIYLEHESGCIKEKYNDQSLCYSVYDIISFSYQMPEHWIFSEDETNFGLIGFSECSEVTMSYSDQKPMSQNMLLGIKDFSSKSGHFTAAVNRKLFDAMYPYQGSKVIEVYMEEGREDEVKAKLTERGYTKYKLQTYARKDKTPE